MKKKIAVTGGIGSGKSTAISLLKKIGYPVFSCDEIYKTISKEKEYIQKVYEVFPSAVQNGKIDRRILSELVFDCETNLVKLNNISHPLIMARLLSEMDNCDQEIVFAEVPLLFEGNFENLFDKIIVISRKDKMRIHSLIVRDQMSSEKIKKRIASQFDYYSKEGEARLKKCKAIVIENNSDISQFENSLKNVLKSLL